jgi:hypothetical protein
MSMAAVAMFGPKVADATNVTYNYVGAPFTQAECVALGFSSSNCVNGNVFGSLTFQNLPSGYTGTLTATSSPSIASATSAYQLSANGVPGGPLTLQNSGYFESPNSITFVNGSITAWGFRLYNPNSGLVLLLSSSSFQGFGADDEANNGRLLVTGATATAGTWTLAAPGAPTVFAKALGAPCDVPGGCAVGDPINPATGNVYEQVTDYQSGGLTS